VLDGVNVLFHFNIVILTQRDVLYEDDLVSSEYGLRKFGKRK